MPELKNSAWRNDAYAKVTGKIKYTDDLKFPDALHAVPVYSNYVHALIHSIDTSRAEQSPGVVKVLTFRDVPGENRWGQIIHDYRIFADDKIRYTGDVIALIVAKNRESAIQAVPLVSIDVTELPAIVDPEKALLPDSPLIHESHGSNIINTHVVHTGDISSGFRESDVVIEETFQTQLIEHAYLETESAVCVPRPDGVIEIFGSMQHPFSTRRFVAAVLGAQLSDVEITGMPMGGGFGGKDDTAAIVCARTALAAKILGKPVRTSYRRDWSMRESYKRHPYKIRYKLGIKSDGKIQAVQCSIIADGGAYCSVTPWVTWRSTVQCCGPYVVPNVDCNTVGVYTNNPVTGAMRGFGSPQMNFVVESVIEIAAVRLSMPANELRRLNMVRQGSVTITGQKLDEHTVAMEQVFEEVVREFQVEEKLKRCSHGTSDSDELYGVGLAMSYRGMSLGAEGTDFCAAIVNAQADGSVLLEVGVHENGQGSESAMILLLAEELGIPKERIRYRRSSTSSIPDSGTTVASRATLMGGGATVLAARNLKKVMSAAVATKFHIESESVIFEGGNLFSPDRSHRMSFPEAVTLMFSKQLFPYALGVFQAPRVTWNEENGQGNAYFTWVYGCQAVELTVNKKTGKVTLLNAIAAHDIGKAVNPPMVLGQYFGGMAMGTGYGLREKVHTRGGKITTTNLNTYRIPRSIDLPEMKAIIVENRDPLSPSGAKGIGEPSNELMAPALANAVFHATGVRYTELPIPLKL